MYQSLFKRVGASLEKLKILEKKNPGRRGQGRFMNGEQAKEKHR